MYSRPFSVTGKWTGFFYCKKIALSEIRKNGKGEIWYENRIERQRSKRI